MQMGRRNTKSERTIGKRVFKGTCNTLPFNRNAICLPQRVGCPSCPKPMELNVGPLRRRGALSADLTVGAGLHHKATQPAPPQIACKRHGQRHRHRIKLEKRAFPGGAGPDDQKLTSSEHRTRRKRNRHEPQRGRFSIVLARNTGVGESQNFSGVLTYRNSPTFVQHFD